VGQNEKKYPAHFNPGWNFVSEGSGRLASREHPVMPREPIEQETGKPSGINARGSPKRGRGNGKLKLKLEKLRKIRGRLRIYWEAENSVLGRRGLLTVSLHNVVESMFFKGTRVAEGRLGVARYSAMWESSSGKLIPSLIAASLQLETQEVHPSSTSPNACVTTGHGAFIKAALVICFETPIQSSHTPFVAVPHSEELSREWKFSFGVELKCMSS
jgi:hypothetical protein